MEPVLRLLEKKLIKRDMPILGSNNGVDASALYTKPTLLESDKVILTLHEGFCPGIITGSSGLTYAGLSSFALSVFSNDERLQEEFGLGWAHSYDGGYGESILLTDTSFIGKEVPSPVVSNVMRPLAISPVYSSLLHYDGFRYLYNSIDSVSKFWDTKKMLRNLFGI